MPNLTRAQCSTGSTVRRAGGKIQWNPGKPDAARRSGNPANKKTRD